MKILNLYFKNINSLEGENRIDFEQPPFTDTGVFAITGPNGSGKSTVLDAITLALYGETFRFDKPAQHVITNYTNESFSQIEFALGTNKYRSSWEVKREDGYPWGEVLPTKMQLVQLNDDEAMIASTSQEVCAQIAEITGMNFRSFTRSIMLAQGDFAAFLNALDTERMDILEKIIGTDIYVDYKREANDKLAEAEKKLTYLQQDLAAVPLIEPVSLEACELDLADFSEQAAEFQEEINQLTALKSQLNETLTISSQIEVQETRLQEAITKRSIVQEKLDLLSKAENALLFEDDIEASKQKKAALENQQSALNAFRNELKQIEGALTSPGYDASTLAQQDLADRPQSFTEQKQAIDGIRNQVNLLNANWQSEIILQRSLSGQIDEKKAALEVVSAWLEAHATDKPLLENFPDLQRLNELRVTLAEFEAKKKALEKWSKSTSTALEKTKNNSENKNEKIKKLNQLLVDLKKELEALAQGKSRTDIEELQAEQHERVKAFQELVSLSVASDGLSPKKSFFFGLFGKNNSPDRNAEELEAELEALKQQQLQEDNIRLALERSVSNDALLTRMQQDRGHLVDGKPCPLCGSTNHPYSTRPPAPANAKQALLDQRLKIKRLNLKLSELSEQVKLARRNAEKNHARAKQLEQITMRWLALCNQLNTASADLDINKTGLMKRLLKTESTDLKNIGILLTKVKGIEKRITKTSLAIEKNAASISQLQATIQSIDAEWQTEPQRLSETENGIAKTQQEEQELLVKITEQLTMVGEILPAKDKELALAEALRSRRQDYESYVLRSQSLTTEMELLISQHAAGQAKIDSYIKSLDSFTNQLQKEEVVGLHLALVEKQILIADKEYLINQLKSEIDALELAIAQKMKESPFNSRDEINTVLELIGSQDKFVSQKEMFDETVNQGSLELETLYSVMENQIGKDKPTMTEEDIELKIKAAKEKMDMAEMEACRLEAIVREQKQFKEKHAAILAKLESQQAQVVQAKTEVAEITAQSGLVFRRRVQEIMVERLLSQTNATLEKISGRYYLRKKPSDRGLALEIEDTYQGNVRRLPKTLSGGESFIVSLALALGLSEMANNGKSVDSLFLDEGFGNLDAETLYTVINTLEGLRAHGKKVGVISHVEAVQKRFKVQLQLVKKPNGLGQLRKVS